MAGSWCLGVEIGGTKLQLGLGAKAGEIAALRRLRVDPARHAKGIRDQIVAAFPPLLADAGIEQTAVAAAGIGFGGPVDAGRGRVERSFQIEGWDDFPLADWIREDLDIPAVVVHNDADTAGLAESRFGAGKGLSPLLYMTVGSGIGGALIARRPDLPRIRPGAAEIGHLAVPVGDEGKAGSSMTWLELELVASGWAMGNAAQALLDAGALVSDPDGIRSPATGVMVAEAARKGQPDAVRIVRRGQDAIGFALAQAIAMIAPRRIVIGGGVSLNGPEWFETVRSDVDRYVFTPFRDGFDIVPAALGEEVVIHGAVALARDALTRDSMA